MTDLLTDIKELMKQERELFGESLLLEYPQKEREEPVAKKKTVAREEPLLFELPGVPVPPLTTEPWGTAASLVEFESQIRDCVKCPLGQTRTNFVFGVGNPQATLMLIGEAPGAEEDAQGEPFVGRAGQLLNKILEAIHFKREEVYICNILKCRPPGNLKKQIVLIRPKLILCLGLTAIENLLQTTESLTALRGRVLTHDGIPVMVTYHPAALLRNPNWKRPAWEDLQAARKLHDELVAKGSA
jgi:uracil-DNA glycosylase family 4